jgi:hypothetical protein
VDLTFLKDIRVSNKYAFRSYVLKFKHSYVDFRQIRPQNGQIEAPNSQTLDLEILDLESPDFLSSSSRIHKSHKGERPQDDIGSRFQFVDGLLYYQGLFYIPNGPCRLQVL